MAVVQVFLHDKNAKLPVYSSEGAACADVYGINDKRIVINPGQSAVISTGLSFNIPDGYEVKVYSRSGHGFKNGIRLSNSVGIIDSDYTGIMQVKLHNDSDTAYFVEPFERIAQIQVKRAEKHVFMLGTEVKETARGDGGFGSTGK